MFLFPKIPDTYARMLAQEYQTLASEETAKVARAKRGSHQTNTTYAATGGTRVSDERLGELAARVDRLANTFGFPEKLSLSAQRQFDFELMKIVYELPLVPAESARNEVWQYLTCILFPHIVTWRHQGPNGVTSAVRFVGGVRNAFQRLFLRAKILHHPNIEKRWIYLDPESEFWLSEDQQVALTERTSLARESVLCTQLARAYNELVSLVPPGIDSPSQTFFREAMKRVIRELAFVRVAALLPVEVGELAQRVFVDSLTGLGGGLDEPTSPVEESFDFFAQVLSLLEPQVAASFAELAEVKADELDDMYRILLNHSEWLEREATRKSISMTVALDLIDSLDKMYFIAKSSSSAPLRRIVTCAIYYFTSLDDAISYDSTNGYEDDRDVVNAVAAVIGHPELAVKWLDAPRDIKIPPMLRDVLEGLIPRAKLLDDPNQALWEYRLVLLDHAKSIGDIQVQHVEALYRGFNSLLGEIQGLSQLDQLLLKLGIVYFLESDDIAGDLDSRGLLDDIQVFNSLAEYFGREDLLIDPDARAEVMESFTLVKRLSANDVGETGSHQAGIHLPKEVLLLDAFDLASDEKNPDLVIEALDREQQTWEIRIVYYNNSSFGGTRDELRLTRLSQFIKHRGLGAGDAIVLSFNGDWQIESLTSDQISVEIPESGWVVLRQGEIEVPA